MLVLESIRAVRIGLSGAGEICSFERIGMGLSTGPVLGLRWLLLPEAFRGLAMGSESGAGAAGNRNSGMGLAKVLEDLRCTERVDDWGLLGPPLGIRPNRSGGYEAVNSGEDVPLCENEPDWGVEGTVGGPRDAICKLLARLCE